MAADVYVGQGELAGACLWLGPGFRARSFSRLTGGQWAGSRASRGPSGLLGPPQGLAEAFVGWLSLGVTAGDREPGARCSHWRPRTLLGHEPSAAEVGHWSEGRGPVGWQHPVGVQAGWQGQHPSPGRLVWGTKPMLPCCSWVQKRQNVVLVGRKRCRTGSALLGVFRGTLPGQGHPMGVALMGPWYPS